MQKRSYVPPLFYGRTPRQLTSQVKEALSGGSPEERREDFNEFRRRMVEEVCSFPPTKMPLPKATSEKVKASIGSMSRWLAQISQADTERLKFLNFMISKATVKSGNKLAYHNYHHMMDVIINATLLTCIWISEGKTEASQTNASDLILTMILAAAFHDTVIEHRAEPGRSEELSATFLKDTYSLYLCLHPDLRSQEFCRNIVEAASEIIAYTIPNIRSDIHDRLAGVADPTTECEGKNHLILHMGAILADADVMVSLCLPFKNAVGITRRVKKELWEHNIDIELTLNGFYTHSTPQGFISDPGQHLQDIFNYNRDLCLKRELPPPTPDGQHPAAGSNLVRYLPSRCCA